MTSSTIAEVNYFVATHWQCMDYNLILVELEAAMDWNGTNNGLGVASCFSEDTALVRHDGENSPTWTKSLENKSCSCYCDAIWAHRRLFHEDLFQIFKPEI